MRVWCSQGAQPARKNAEKGAFGQKQNPEKPLNTGLFRQLCSVIYAQMYSRRKPTWKK
jgi:hypothetical protein